MSDPQPPTQSPIPVSTTTRAGAPTLPSQRLASLDAYRGAIMVILAGSGFGIAKVAAEFPDDATWQTLAFHFEHPEWLSRFKYLQIMGVPWGVSFWDLIQPAFMFMVGVALPYSYARRKREGQPPWLIGVHTVKRAVILVLLGVFLYSQGKGQTNFIFTNVLAQIGLGYVFAFLLMGRGVLVQLAAMAAILVGYWYWFYQYPVAGANFDWSSVGVDPKELAPFTGAFAHWNKNANAAAAFDQWLLNLFPRSEPFKYNSGGYQTLNFVPSIVTMVLGVMCGELIRSPKRTWLKLLLLVLGGGVCLALGVAAGETVCPVVKRIWTPSWTLFSGGWVIWILAAFYLVFDVCRLKPLAFPLIVVGMNSIVMYMLGQLLKPWTARTLETHVGQDVFSGPYGPLVQALSVLAVFWVVCLWMYRQRIFVRI